MGAPARRNDTATIPALTGFRALAAGLVVIGHVARDGALDHAWPLRYGWTGVNLFFALSGFLFTRLYLDRFADGAVSLRRYFLKRAFRVLPLTWFLLAVTIASWPHYEVLDVLTHVTLTHAWFFAWRFSLNAPMWSLCVEESFYLVVPALFVALGALERSPRFVTTAARIAAVVVALAVVTEAGAGLALSIQQADHAFHGRWDDGFWSSTLPGRFSDFACGIVAGVVSLRLPITGPKGSRAVATTLVAAGVAVWTFAAAWAETRGGIVAAAAMPMFQIVGKLFAVGGALAILGLYGRSWATPLFASRAFVYAGRISFALYLVQFARIGPRGTVVDGVGVTVRSVVRSEVLAVIVVYVALSALAAALHHLVEEPAQRRLRERFLGAEGT